MGQHLDTMVGDSQKGVLKIDHVALHVDCHNLTCTVTDDLVPYGIS